MDNFKLIYRILRYLEKAMDYEEADMDCVSPGSLHISENRWTAIMEMLGKEGYIDGIFIKRSSGGDAVVSIPDLRITLKGLEYLEENSMMKKAGNIVKGIADVII